MRNLYRVVGFQVVNQRAVDVDEAIDSGTSRDVVKEGVEHLDDSLLLQLVITPVDYPLHL